MSKISDINSVEWLEYICWCISTCFRTMMSYGNSFFNIAKYTIDIKVRFMIRIKYIIICFVYLNVYCKIIVHMKLQVIFLQNIV